MTKRTSSSLLKLVNILSDGNFHDGTSIGEKLKMTRSAVWKAIKKLENYGVQIDSVKGKGYALLEPFKLLDAAKIKKNIAGEKIDLVVFESITSTNDYLKTVRNSKSPKFCLAEQQTQGRGRLQRQWYSPFGKNVYLSCFFPFKKDISELAGLSLVTSLALMSAFKEIGIKEHLYVKWPNDILYANKKLSGSLIEVMAETHGLSEAIIGIGVNVNMLDDEKAITQAWTSLRQILNQYIDRNEFCAVLMANLLKYLRQFEERGFAPFIEEWMRVDGLLNRMISVKNINETILGTVVGVNEQGHLLLRLANGMVQPFSSGDTSILKNT